MSSVTRFGETLHPLQNSISLWAIFSSIHKLFGKLLCLLGNFYATGEIFIVVNGQRLKNNLVIWSHCSWFKLGLKDKMALGFSHIKRCFHKKVGRSKSLKNWRQCDQIGLFLEGLREKFSYKRSPNNWWLFGPFWKRHYLGKNWHG